MMSSREEKLAKLKEDKASKGMLIVTDGEPFVKALGDKVERLKEVLGNGVEISNIDELLDQLGLIQQFQAEVKSLKDALKEHKLPDSVAVAGLDNLTEKLVALNKLDSVTSSIEKLDNTFQKVTKALSDDIYARYDFSNSSVGAKGQYIGYLNQKGNWFIQLIGEQTNGDKSSRFAAGLNDYQANWSAKERLGYTTRDKVIIQ